MPTYELEATATWPAGQDGPWQPGRTTPAGTVIVTQDEDGEPSPSWETAREIHDVYYDVLIDAVHAFVDTADLELDVLHERNPHARGTLEEWLDFDDYIDDAERELMGALDGYHLPRITWTRTDNGASVTQALNAWDLQQRGENLDDGCETAWDALTLFDEDDWPGDDPPESEAVGEREPQPVRQPGFNYLPDPVVPCPTCGDGDRVQFVVKGYPYHAPHPDERPRLRFGGCAVEHWPNRDWWCPTCEIGYDGPGGSRPPAGVAWVT